MSQNTQDCSEETKLEETEEVGEIELTPGEALDQMILAWRCELAAPELLNNRSELVESVLEQIRDVEEQLKRAEKNAIDTTLRKMEIDRIRYVVTSYLRCRLRKIEKYVFHVVSSDEKRKQDGEDARMSPEEAQFAIEYRRHIEEYLHAVALQNMPANAQRLDREKIADAPNLNHFVLIRMQRKVTDVAIQNVSEDTREIEVDLDVDTQHILPYKAAAPLVRSGSAYLM